MDVNVQTILAGLILAGVLWLARSVNEYGRTLTKLQTVLTGAEGNNGLSGEVRELRRRSHQHGDVLHSLKGETALLDQRVTSIEERIA